MTLTVVGWHENWTLVLRCQVSGVSSENARAGLKPMLGQGSTTPDNVQKKRAIFIVFYDICYHVKINTADIAHQL